MSDTGTSPCSAPTSSCACAVFGSDAIRTICATALHRDLRQLLEGLAHLLGRVLVVLELPGEVLLVRAEIEEPVARQVEHDHLRLAALAASLRLIDDDADRVRRLG